MIPADFQVTGAMSQAQVAIQSDEQAVKLINYLGAKKQEFTLTLANSQIDTDIFNACKTAISVAMNLLGTRDEAEKEALEMYPELFIQHAIYNHSVSKIEKFFERYPNFTEHFLDSKEIIWKINDKEMTPVIPLSLMHIPVGLGNLEVAKILFEKGLRIDIKTSHFDNPLQAALIHIFSEPSLVENSSSERYLLVKFLIENSTPDSINQRSDMDGMTLLDMVHHFRLELDEDEEITKDHQIYSNLHNLEECLVANGAKTTEELPAQPPRPLDILVTI